MKEIIILSLIHISLFATALQNISSSFSLSEREELLQQLHTNSNITKANQLYKGWNLLQAPKHGIDIFRTFSDLNKVKIIASYDEESKKWGLVSLNKVKDDKDILRLKYIEPNSYYFVLANEDMKLEFKNKQISTQCVEFLNDKHYDFIQNSVLDKGETLSKDKTLSLTTRYLTNYEVGTFDDTRVLLIYPKVTSLNKNRAYKYGPAIPKIALKFTKEYEGKYFYVYDYKYEKCYKGIFPSLKIPPFPSLRELK